MPKIKPVFATAAITSGVAWLTKVAVYAAFGENPAVGLLWGLGMVSFLVAASAGTALLLHRAPVWVRIAAAVAAAPVAFSLLDMLDAGVKEIYPGGGWFRDEVALLVAGVMLAAVGVKVIGGGRTRALESA